LLLGENLAGIKLDQHCSVGLHFLERDGKPKVVENQKLKFEVIELRQWQAADLCISGISIENVGEDLLAQVTPAITSL